MLTNSIIPHLKSIVKRNLKKSGITPDFFLVSAQSNYEVIFMQFTNLQKLIQESSSSRKYLLSLPVPIQMQLHEQNDFIHTQYELRRNAEYLMKYGT